METRTRFVFHLSLKSILNNFSQFSISEEVQERLDTYLRAGLRATKAERKAKEKHFNKFVKKLGGADE